MSEAHPLDQEFPLYDKIEALYQAEIHGDIATMRDMAVSIQNEMAEMLDRAIIEAVEIRKTKVRSIAKDLDWSTQAVYLRLHNAYVGRDHRYVR